LEGFPRSNFRRELSTVFHVLLTSWNSIKKRTFIALWKRRQRALVEPVKPVCLFLLRFDSVFCRLKWNPFSYPTGGLQSAFASWCGSSNVHYVDGFLLFNCHLHNISKGWAKPLSLCLFV
jgi:hypothetical protein